MILKKCPICNEKIINGKCGTCGYIPTQADIDAASAHQSFLNNKLQEMRMIQESMRRKEQMDPQDPAVSSDNSGSHKSTTMVEIPMKTEKKTLFDFKIIYRIYIIIVLIWIFFAFRGAAKMIAESFSNMHGSNPDDIQVIMYDESGNSMSGNTTEEDPNAMPDTKNNTVYQDEYDRIMNKNNQKDKTAGSEDQESGAKSGAADDEIYYDDDPDAEDSGSGNTGADKDIFEHIEDLYRNIEDKGILDF